MSSSSVMAALAVGTAVVGGWVFALFWTVTAIIAAREWLILIGFDGSRLRTVWLVMAASIVLSELTFGAEAERRYGAPYLLMHRGDLHAALASAVPPERIAFVRAEKRDEFLVFASEAACITAVDRFTEQRDSSGRFVLRPQFDGSDDACFKCCCARGCK